MTACVNWVCSMLFWILFLFFVTVVLEILIGLGLDLLHVDICLLLE